MSVSKSDINPKTGKAYAVNPSSGVWDDNYWAQQVDPVVNAAEKARQASPSNPTNVIANAQALQDFTVKQNQPAIQSYQASKAPLQDRYKALLDTIKGNQTTAENRQTLTTGNELAKRGISNDSGVYQQEQTNAVNPITQAFTGQYKDANAQQGIDMSAIDNAIAQLQTGNPESSINAALGIGQQEQSANQFSQSLAMQQQQNSTANDQFSQNLAMQQQQNALANAIAQGQLANQTKETNYSTGKPYYQPQTSSNIDISGIIKLLQQTNGGQVPASFKPN